MIRRVLAVAIAVAAFGGAADLCAAASRVPGLHQWVRGAAADVRIYDAGCRTEARQTYCSLMVTMRVHRDATFSAREQLLRFSGAWQPARAALPTWIFAPAAPRDYCDARNRAQLAADSMLFRGRDWKISAGSEVIWHGEWFLPATPVRTMTVRVAIKGSKPVTFQIPKVKETPTTVLPEGMILLPCLN